MYGPRVLPTTGGSIGLLGLFLGASVGNWTMTAISLILMGVVLLSLHRLRKGEKQDRERLR